MNSDVCFHYPARGISVLCDITKGWNKDGLHITGEFTDRLQKGVIIGLVNFAKCRDTIRDKE